MTTTDSATLLRRIGVQSDYVIRRFAHLPFDTVQDVIDSARRQGRSVGWVVHTLRMIDSVTSDSERMLIAFGVPRRALGDLPQLSDEQVRTIVAQARKEHRDARWVIAQIKENGTRALPRSASVQADETNRAPSSAAARFPPRRTEAPISPPLSICVWNDALDEVRASAPQPGIRAWLRAMRLLDIQHGRVVVQAPQEAAPAIQRIVAPLLEERLSAMAGTAKVRVVVLPAPRVVLNAVSSDDAADETDAVAAPSSGAADAADAMDAVAAPSSGAADAMDAAVIVASSSVSDSESHPRVDKLWERIKLAMRRHCPSSLAFDAMTMPARLEIGASQATIIVPAPVFALFAGQLLDAARQAVASVLGESFIVQLVAAPETHDDDVSCCSEEVHESPVWRQVRQKAEAILPRQTVLLAFRGAYLERLDDDVARIAVPPHRVEVFKAHVASFVQRSLSRILGRTVRVEVVAQARPRLEAPGSQANRAP